MNPSTDRPAPVGAYLALFAGVVALFSLALPWFRFDELALAEGMQNVIRRVTASLGTDIGTADPADIQAMGAAATDAAAVKIRGLVEGKLHGYQDNPIWVIMRVLTVVGVFAAALKVMKGEVTGASQRGAFLAIGAVLAIRPVMILLANPFDDAQAREVGFDMAQIVPIGPGVYAALLAAAMMVGAGLLSHLGDPVAEPAYVEHSAPMANGPVPQAYVPGGIPVRQPAMPAVAPQPVPQAYIPGNAAGMPSPSVYVPGAAATQQPATARAPVPGSPPIADAPRRGASVAPPGTF